MCDVKTYVLERKPRVGNDAVAVARKRVVLKAATKHPHSTKKVIQ